MAAASRSQLLAFCRSLPHVTEDVKWGNDLVFSVGGKMFAGFDKNAKDATFGCKVPEEDFVAMTRLDGIKPAAYAARFHWIEVEDPDALPADVAMTILRGSYDLVKETLPKGVQKTIDAAKAKPARAKAKPARAKAKPARAKAKPASAKAKPARAKAKPC